MTVHLFMRSSPSGPSSLLKTRCSVVASMPEKTSSRMTIDFLEYTARAIAYMQFVSIFLFPKLDIVMEIPIVASGRLKA